MWDQINFSDTLVKNSVGRKNQINASEILSSGKYPVIDQGKDFIAGYCDDETILVSEDLPLIIFGDHTRCFKYVDFPFVIGADGTKALRPNMELFDAKYYYFALLSLAIPSRGYNRHFTLLKEKKVPKPERSEQIRIAYVLSTVQTSIEQQARLIKLTRELKSALMHKLFTEGLRGEKQKKTEIGLVPASWEVNSLKQYCNVVTSSLPYTQLIKLKEYRGSDAVELLGIKVSDMNLLGNENRILKSNLIKKASQEFAQKKAVPPGTVVFPKRGAAIATNKKRLTTTWTVFDPNLIGVKTKEGLNTEFIYYWFQLFDLRRITDPGPTPQLNKKDLEPLLIPIPQDISEQIEIADILETIDNRMNLISAKKGKLEDLFRTLLHQLMTGRTCVNDIDLPEFL